ncbi:gamma-glutamyltransferase family protein [Burkholderia vietnamiensis]|uniref:gamma-glutamyltransferase family protein n=1 Tax=Burkholderia vietnamiensis TaxID=60552 RepID=UPI0039B4B3F8
MTGFDWHNPYPTTRIPVFARNVVSTSHPLAAQAGLRMLWKGGNAVDAALAAAAAITVVEPVSCGLGGDAFALVWDGERLSGLNASGVAPAAWNPDYFRRRHGEDAHGIAKQPMRGWDTVTVPGVIAGWEALHAKFGSLPFADLLEPAIELAERGYSVSPIVAHKWAAAVPEMLDDAYLAERAKLIDRTRATHFAAGRPHSGGTIYLSAADERGMMVSFIQSNYMGFGSGLVVPGTGIALQNRGHGFSMDPRSPNVVAGGKRPFHTIIPAFVTEQVDGRTEAVMSFGVMGGDMQPQGHLQTIVRMLGYHQQPQAACCAPRWKVNRDFTLDVEATMNRQTVDALAARGHTIKSVDDPYMDFGSGQFVWRLDPDDPERGYVAASDSRRDGLAAGF